MNAASQPDAGGTKPGRSNLQLRVISAIILGIAVLALTWWGGTPFRLFAVIVGALVFHEWSTLSKDRYSWPHRMSVWVLLLAALAVLAIGADAITIFGAIGIAVVGAGVSAVVLGQGYGLVAGLAYAAVPAASLALLRGGDQNGLWAILFLFACVWATDIAAYFAGRAIGGPKLAPSVSPSKTWSGAIGGAIAAALAAGIVALLGPSSSGLIVAVLIALAISVVSQFGDLFESAYKRRHGAKDSGNIIPGHGGVMDRVDGLVAAAVALFLAGAVLASFDSAAAGLFSS